MAACQPAGDQEYGKNEQQHSTKAEQKQHHTIGIGFAVAEIACHFPQKGRAQGSFADIQQALHVFLAHGECCRVAEEVKDTRKRLIRQDLVWSGPTRRAVANAPG